MGGMTFIDLRDRYGITQLVFNEALVGEALVAEAEKLGREYVIQITGEVTERENKNPKLATGDIEIAVSTLRILNPAEVPPFTIDDDGTTGTWYTHPKREYLRPTSEFNSHLAVHNDQVERRAVDFQSVIHAQPPYLVQLSHMRDIRSTKEFNRRILRWEPETIVQLPAGIEVLDFMVPGSQTLMESSVEALRVHVMVMWSKHGIMVRSDADPLAAVDKVEYAETGAMYEVRNLMTGGLGEGVTTDELRAVASAFDVPTDLL